jgi:hypothetical protein
MLTLLEDPDTRLEIRRSHAFQFATAAVILGSVIACLWSGQALLLLVPLPFVLLAAPAVARFLDPDEVLALEEQGVRLGEELLPYGRIAFARLGGPAAADFVCLHGVDGGLLRTVKLQKAGEGAPSVYAQHHLNFVSELNRRVRRAGNPGLN